MKYMYEVFLNSIIIVNSDTDAEPAWLLQDDTFEEKGALMAENRGRLLEMYDKLSSFLGKIKVFNNHGFADTRELTMFPEQITLIYAAEQQVC